MASRVTTGYTNKPKAPLYNQGGKLLTVQAEVAVLAAWNDGDTVILARNITLASRVVSIIMKTAGSITGALDYDIGVYKAGDSDGDSLGDVIDADILADGLDFDAGVALGADILGSGLTFYKYKTLGELLGYESEAEFPVGGVHIVMTLNTAGSATADLDMEIKIDPAG